MEIVNQMNKQNTIIWMEIVNRMDKQICS